MPRKTNNEYLEVSANVLDPDGRADGRQLNNDYLKRISESLVGGLFVDGSDIESKLRVVGADAIDSMFEEGA